MKIIKTIRKMLKSIQSVDEYVEKKIQRDQDKDRRLNELFRATMDGEQEWFLDLVKRDPSCALDIIRECKLNDESTE